MTIADSLLPQQVNPIGFPRVASHWPFRAMHVCWRTAGLITCTGSQSRQRGSWAALAVDLNIHDHGRACTIEVWTEDGKERSILLTRQPMRCELMRERGLFHVDIHSDVERLLAITLRESDGSLLFAQTPLLAKAGLTGGTYDPPRVQLLKNKGVA